MVNGCATTLQCTSEQKLRLDRPIDARDADLIICPSDMVYVASEGRGCLRAIVARKRGPAGASPAASGDHE